VILTPCHVTISVVLSGTSLLPHVTLNFSRGEKRITLMNVSNRTAFLGDNKTGDLWKPVEYRKIIQSHARNGTLLKLYDAATNKNQIIKQVSWSALAFGCESHSKDAESIITGKIKSCSYSFPMALGDERGHVYCIDFMRNRFWVVARTGVRVTCLGFSEKRRRELLIGMQSFPSRF